MHDLVGDRLQRETAANRKNQWQYAALYSFLAANVIFILVQLCK